MAVKDTERRLWRTKDRASNPLVADCAVHWVYQLLFCGPLPFRYAVASLLKPEAIE
jgi:hypothetical protein